MWSAFFCAVNITGDIENLFPIRILLDKSKIAEIWTNYSKIEFKVKKYIWLKDFFTEINCKKSLIFNIVNGRRHLTGGL